MTIYLSKPMKTLHLRKTWRFGKFSRSSLRVSFTPLDECFGISLNVDGGEGEVTFFIGFFFGLWITLGNGIPKNWYPDYPCSDGKFILGAGERELSLRFHHWNFWWNFWMDPSTWNSTDPKWRRGSTSFERWILGRHDCEFTEIDRRGYLLPFLEGNYSVMVKQRLRTDRWKRWFTKKSIAWEIEAGYHDENHNWVAVPVPHEGKGENSYDQGEDGTYSLNFGRRKDINTHYAAALYFWKSNMETRERRGNASWRPKKFRDIKLDHIKANPVTD